MVSDKRGLKKEGIIKSIFFAHSYCAPVFAKFEKRLEKDKRDLIRHIDTHQMKLDSKIAYLEKKTKEQLFGLNQSMKEAFAAERGECLDRMERRALRERIAIERQQVRIKYSNANLISSNQSFSKLCK